LCAVGIDQLHLRSGVNIREHIVILLELPVILWQTSFLGFFGRKLLFATNQRREASSSAMASDQATHRFSPGAHSVLE
jgi:hypothetical protein